MKLIFLGEAIGPTISYNEWFPDFNYWLQHEYLADDFEITTIPKQKVGNDYVYEIFGKKLRANGNNLFIANPENEKIIGFSTFFDLRQLFNLNSDIFKTHLIKLYSGHYNELTINTYFPDYKDIISPWYFRPYREDRKYSTDYDYSPVNGKLGFRGLHIPLHRDFLLDIQNKNRDDIDIITNSRISIPEKYYKWASEYLAALSAPGIRDMCYRDIECFRQGIPVIRPKFTSKLLIDIPEDAYIPIDHDYITSTDKEGLIGMPSDSKKLATQVIDVWDNVKKDKDLLEKTSKKAKEFYYDNFTREIIGKRSYELIKTSGLLNS